MGSTVEEFIRPGKPTEKNCEIHETIFRLSHIYLWKRRIVGGRPKESHVP
jgi:hypothetical protein